MNNKTQKLYRSKTDKYIGGVCGGLATYTGLESNMIRLLMVISVFVGGIGFVLYIAALLIVSENPNETEPERPERPETDKTFLWGIIFVSIGAFILLREMDLFDLIFIDLPWSTIWAILLIAAGAALIYRQYQQKETQTEIAEIDPDAASSNASTSQKSTFDIYRSRSDKKISGVCAGIAKHFNVDPTLVRLGWVVLSIASKGLGVLIYFALVFILPEEESTEQTV
ncbi:MAG: PspC domain-containing protein [Calditrichaeota bacterium]|nr:PspC domain-containing protein [Calditrichota bacterium]MCB0268238.1 PspC domain-containing protein [Calditrichota bacterium]